MSWLTALIVATVLGLIGGGCSWEGVSLEKLTNAQQGTSDPDGYYVVALVFWVVAVVFLLIAIVLGGIQILT